MYKNKPLVDTTTRRAAADGVTDGVGDDGGDGLTVTADRNE